MNVVHCPPDEQNLFDSMLQYNYCQRPTASKVLEDLKSIEEERRERERRELERREAERRRREAERRRREEDIRSSEAERRQREREEAGWCCIL